MADDFDPIQDALQALARTAGGEEFLTWLLRDVCGVLRSPMAGTHTDTAYLCGKQDVGYQLLPHVARVMPHLVSNLAGETK